MRSNTMLAAALAVVLSGCATSPEALRIEMGSQANNPPSVEKSTAHSDPLINTVIDAGVEAAARLGFAYDASGATDSRLIVTAQWKGSPVVLYFHFARQPDGAVGYTYLRECNGNVLVDRGDAKILRLFEDALAHLMESAAPSSTSRIQGTVVGGRYKNPQGTFSIAIPQWAVASGDIEDYFISYAGRVAFADDAGRYAIVETVRADDPQHIERLKSTKALDEIMRSMVGTYKAGLPTELLCHSEMKCAGHTGRLFVCQFTGGATIVDKDTGRRPDCYRAYFIFIHGTTLYTLTTQTIREQGVEWSVTLRKSMENDITEFASSLELTDE